MGIKAKAKRYGGISKQHYGSELAAYKHKLFGQQLGQILRRVEKLPVFDESLRERMAAARKARNFLVHHFWRDRIPMMLSAEGLRQAQDDLQKLVEGFSKLSDDIENAL